MLFYGDDVRESQRNEAQSVVVKWYRKRRPAVASGVFGRYADP
jgi:hypothetical protein